MQAEPSRRLWLLIRLLDIQRSFKGAPLSTDQYTALMLCGLLDLPKLKAGSMVGQPRATMERHWANGTYVLTTWLNGGYVVQKIVRNAGQCLKCLDVIESKHRHDFVTCKCGNVSVDGGKAYLRRSWNPGSALEDAFLDLSEMED